MQDFAVIVRLIDPIQDRSVRIFCSPRRTDERQVDGPIEDLTQKH